MHLACFQSQAPSEGNGDMEVSRLGCSQGPWPELLSPKLWGCNCPACTEVTWVLLDSL